MGKLKAPELSYAIIELSPAAYGEISKTLLMEGFGDHIRDDGGSIDMHGIVLTSSAHPKADPETHVEPNFKNEGAD